jgi:hypothetical protein
MDSPLPLAYSSSVKDYSRNFSHSSSYSPPHFHGSPSSFEIPYHPLSPGHSHAFASNIPDDQASPIPLLNIYVSEPTSVQCPFCKSNITTRVEYKIGNSTWLICLLLCVFCFPFCVYALLCNLCQDTYHFCPCCEELVAIKTPF